MVQLPCAGPEKNPILLHVNSPRLGVSVAHQLLSSMGQRRGGSPKAVPARDEMYRDLLLSQAAIPIRTLLQMTRPISPMPLNSPSSLLQARAISRASPSSRPRVTIK